MLSSTSEYALRALIYLVQHEEDWPVTSDEIAKHTGISGKYLSKILSDLTRTGLLDSTRGKHGGYWLAREASDVTLYDTIVQFERFDDRRCPFGNGKCGQDDPCLAHDRWKKVVDAEQAFLRRTSISDVAIQKSAAKKKTTRPKKKKKKKSARR